MMRTLINALSTPKHGRASGEVIHMLGRLALQGGALDERTEKFLIFKRGSEKKALLMGFGRRVHQTAAPRATLLKEVYEKLAQELGQVNPFFRVIQRLEFESSKASYLKARNLYPHIDFYAGLIYCAMNISAWLYPALFALGRTAGWYAHFKEASEDRESRLIRFVEIYSW